MSAVIFTSGYLEGDDDLTSLKGHRSDVLFSDDEKNYYELNFITVERLVLEIKLNNEKGENCFADVGLVVSNSITKNSIVDAVRHLVKRKYFTTQKALQPVPKASWFYVEI
jgi:hypothetical protein